MSYRNRIFTIMWYLSLTTSLFLLFSVSTFSQETTREDKERNSLLMHPTNFKVELDRRQPEQYDSPDELTRPFKPSENIYFLLMITSNLPDTLEVQIFNRYYQNRPELLRDGQPVAYRDDITKNLAMIDALAENERRVETVNLKPGVPTIADRIELRDWYATLEPSSYNLIIRHRFIVGGDWIETSSITFEVQK